MARLTCDGCGVSTGRNYPTYQAWSDEARRLGWVITEESVLCAICSGVRAPRRS